MHRPLRLFLPARRRMKSSTWPLTSCQNQIWCIEPGVLSAIDWWYCISTYPLCNSRLVSWRTQVSHRSDMSRCSALVHRWGTQEIRQLPILDFVRAQWGFKMIRIHTSRKWASWITSTCWKIEKFDAARLQVIARNGGKLHCSAEIQLNRGKFIVIHLAL